MTTKIPEGRQKQTRQNLSNMASKTTKKITKPRMDNPPTEIPLAAPKAPKEKRLNWRRWMTMMEILMVWMKRTTLIKIN